jgi:hypothetical protein
MNKATEKHRKTFLESDAQGKLASPGPVQDQDTSIAGPGGLQ